MIILENIKTVDLTEIRNKIYFVELDFSMINSLKGNKDLLEQSFQELKKELK